jgi:hypothetical protein
MAIRRVPPLADRIDAGIVDDRVHATERIDLRRDTARLGRAAQIADDDIDPFGRQISHRRCPIAAPGMQDKPVAILQELARRLTAKAVRAASDEDTRHLSSECCRADLEIEFANSDTFNGINSTLVEGLHNAEQMRIPARLVTSRVALSPTLSLTA